MTDDKKRDCHGWRTVTVTAGGPFKAKDQASLAGLRP